MAFYSAIRSTLCRPSSVVMTVLRRWNSPLASNKPTNLNPREINEDYSNGNAHIHSTSCDIADGLFASRKDGRKRRAAYSRMRKRGDSVPESTTTPHGSDDKSHP